MGKRNCYLCTNKQQEDGDNTTKHRFPQDAKTRRLWIQACNLCEETDDVNNLLLCSAHFVPANYTPGTNRLQHGVVPSVKIPGKLPVVETKVEVAEQYEFVELSAVAADDNAEYALDLADDHLVTMEAEVENNNEEVVVTSRNDEDFGPAPKKPRRSFHPRFISEITPEDVQTPADARRVITFVKEHTNKQKMKIHLLQQQNRRLRKKMDSLQMLVRDLRQKLLNG